VGIVTGTLRQICGVALIVMGLVAIPVPIIPGLPFIAAGAAMLGSDHYIVRSCRTWLQKSGKKKLFPYGVFGFK